MFYVILNLHFERCKMLLHEISFKTNLKVDRSLFDGSGGELDGGRSIVGAGGNLVLEVLLVEVLDGLEDRLHFLEGQAIEIFHLIKSGKHLDLRSSRYNAV